MRGPNRCMCPSIGRRHRGEGGREAVVVVVVEIKGE